MIEHAGLRDFEFIVWEMRYTVMRQIVHYRLRANDVWTVEKAPPVAPAAVASIAARAAARPVQL